MNDTTTLRIPADMDQPIEEVWGVNDNLIPVHVVGAGGNPDEFCMAFYIDGAGEDDNDRATMVARAASNDHTMPPLVGDVLLTVDPELAGRIVANDEEFQQHKRTVNAFRAWLANYSDSNGIDRAIVFESVVTYAANVMENATQKAKDDHVNQIASMLGLRPEQVGVIFV